MNDEQKTFLLLILIGAIMIVARSAHAEIGAPERHSGIATAVNVTDGQSRAEQSSMHEIRSAVRSLEQAALQWNLASNTRERALLQSAHDRLAAAIKGLCCAQRARAVQLESDIDQVFVRDSSHLGPLVSPDGEAFGPPAPSRNQLAQLAMEGQDLVRNVPKVRRLQNTDTLDSSNQVVDDARSRPRQDPIDPANGDPVSWPARGPATSPQFHFQF
jgi:hypothetical protein